MIEIHHLFSAVSCVSQTIFIPLRHVTKANDSSGKYFFVTRKNSCIRRKITETMTYEIIRI